MYIVLIHGSRLQNEETIDSELQTKNNCNLYYSCHINYLDLFLSLERM